MKTFKSRALSCCSLLCAILTLVAASTAFGQRAERAVDSWRPLHYSVTVALNEELSEIKAKTDIDLTLLKPNIRVLDVDFGGDLIIDGVTLNQEPVQFQRADGTLQIAVRPIANQTRRLRISVTYHGRPKDGLILTQDKDGKPSATGDNWPDRVHNWIPCLDHPSAKATVQFTVTAPQRETVIANGAFVSRNENSDKTVTWNYNEAVPIPPYCMVIAVGESAVIVPSNTRFDRPLSYVVPQSDRDLAVEFAPSDEMLGLFSKMIGPYPYEKLALIVGATQFGGMENSGAIVFPSNFLQRRPGESLTRVFHIPSHVEETTAHEIAHQWFGDSVTESTWADLWLSEGFATYFAGIFLERHEGQQEFREYMQRQAIEYLAYEKQSLTPIHDTETKDLFRLLNANNYQKGAWVLHMLRGLLGDEQFFRGIRSYYTLHRNANADTNDLREAMERASGRDLNDFFDRWVFQTGHPVYEISWSWIARGSKGDLQLSIKQTQSTAAFLMPLPIAVKTATGEFRKTVTPTGKDYVVRIPLDSQPTEAPVLDPDHIILKEINITPAVSGSGNPRRSVAFKGRRRSKTREG